MAGECTNALYHIIRATPYSYSTNVATILTLVIAGAAAAAVPLLAAAVWWFRVRTRQKDQVQFIPVNGGSFRIRRKGFSEIDQTEGIPMLHLPIKT